LIFIYPIYNHNWRNISTILYTYITRLAPNEIFSPSNKIYREVGRAKDLSAPLYIKAQKKLFLGAQFAYRSEHRVGRFHPFIGHKDP
jgi:hypothetical protein